MTSTRRSPAWLAYSAIAALVLLCVGCAPEVGSPRWCESMREQERGDWTANEALDYARHCIIE